MEDLDCFYFEYLGLQPFWDVNPKDKLATFYSVDQIEHEIVVLALLSLSKQIKFEYLNELEIRVVVQRTINAEEHLDVNKWELIQEFLNNFFN